MPIDYSDLGYRIKIIREKKKMSQMTLSEHCNISRQYMGLIETGERIASIETIAEIAKALEVSIDELLNCSSTHNKKTPVEDILFDCSKSESEILVRNMKQLKKLLKEHKIT